MSIDYPASRARLGVGGNSTYKLTPMQRDIVGVLQSWRLWSNTAIATAYGIDRAAVSRHGKRMSERLHV